MRATIIKWFIIKTISNLLTLPVVYNWSSGCTGKVMVSRASLVSMVVINWLLIDTCARFVVFHAFNFHRRRSLPLCPFVYKCITYVRRHKFADKYIVYTVSGYRMPCPFHNYIWINRYLFTGPLPVVGFHWTDIPLINSIFCYTVSQLCRLSRIYI